MKYSDAEKLLELGLVSREQRDAIVERLKLSPAPTRNYLLVALSCVGGLLVLAGIILLVSANWEEIPPLAKQFSGVALMLAFWVFGLRFVCRKENPHPILGEALCAVGAGLWLGNIALYGQIYQISSEPSKAFATWFLGIFLFPWIVRLRGYGPLAAWTAFPVLALMMAPFCFERMFDCEEVFRAGAATLVPASLLLIAAMLFSFRKKLGVLGGAAAILLGAFPLSLVGISVVDLLGCVNGTIRTAMIIAFFVCGCAAMTLGARVAKKFYVNLGSLMILLSALALAAKVVGTLASSGLALILAGTFLLAFGYFLERQRRKLTAKIKGETTSELL